MYVPSNSPKYICKACKKTIADLDAIFCEEIKGYSLSPDEIANYLKSAGKTANEKERLLTVQQDELQRVHKEIQRTYDLYQQEKLDANGFSRFYKPLEERRNQLEAALPRLQAEVDILKVNNLSAEEIAAQASSLYDHWQTMQPEEKREIVEVITDKIIIGKDEITINLCYAPSSKDIANRWRKGSFLNPFCHLVIKAVRVDSQPQPDRLSKMLTAYCFHNKMTKNSLAAKLGVSLGTLKNWEFRRTHPNRKSRPIIHALLGP